MKTIKHMAGIGFSVEFDGSPADIPRRDVANAMMLKAIELFQNDNKLDNEVVFFESVEVEKKEKAVEEGVEAHLVMSANYDNATRDEVITNLDAIVHNALDTNAFTQDIDDAMCYIQHDILFSDDPEGPLSD